MTDYDVGRWNNQPLYNCRECPYDTLDEQAMQRHVETHRAPPAPEEVQVVVMDRFGNVVGTETVEVDAPEKVQVIPLDRFWNVVGTDTVEVDAQVTRWFEDKQEAGDAEDNAD